MTSLCLKIGLGGSSPSVGGDTSLSDLVALLSTSANSAIWLPAGGSDLYSDSARTTPVTAGSGDPVGAIDDYSGNGHHLLQASSGLRPVATNGVTFDGIDDAIAASLTLSADMALVYAIKTADTAFVPASSSSSTVHSLYAASGGANTDIVSSVFGGNVHIDGTQYTSGATTRGAIFNVVGDNAWHRIENRSAALNTQTGLGFGRLMTSSGAWMAGAIAGIILIDNVALGATDAATALTLAQTVIDAQTGAL